MGKDGRIGEALEGQYLPSWYRERGENRPGTLLLCVILEQDVNNSRSGVLP